MKSNPIKQDFFTAVAPEFDSHVRESIPLYDSFIENLVFNIANNLSLKERNYMHLDICCSTANLGVMASCACGDKYYYDGIDINEAMLSVANETTKDNRNVNVHNIDFYNLAKESLPKYDLITELLGFQFFTKTRSEEIDIIKSMLSESGCAVFCEKFKTPFFDRNEWLKDNFWKSNSFTQEQIDSKKEAVLSDMHDYLAKKSDFEDLLCDKFKFVRAIYVAGNFAAYICSNSRIDIQNYYVDVNLITNRFNATQNCLF